MNHIQLAFSNNILIDRNKCTFCGNCVERCIMDNIRLELSPCRQSCPIDQNCQSYIQQIVRGEIERARDTIYETSPLPKVLGRICSTPCETNCTMRKVNGSSVAIRALKRYAVDNFPRPKPVLIPEEKEARVAIIGSGPAGLMGAWQLRRAGYRVTIYEKNAQPGGNLTTVIPEYRIPKEVVLDEIAWLETWGIKFKTGVFIGTDISINDLQKEYEAVLVATGNTIPSMLEIPGEDAQNVYSARSFLRKTKEGKSPVLGPSVLIIGGGNSAIDAALTAKRLGSDTVRIVCLERSDEMTAYPNAISDAIKEGVTIDSGWGPASFSLEKDLAVAVKCFRCIRVWEKECFSPLLDEQFQNSFSADSFIVAIGEQPDFDLLKSLGISSIANLKDSVDPLTLETKEKNIFVAGDVFSGPTSVVEAMGSGKQAAISIDRYISGDDLRYGRAYQGPYILEFDIDLKAANSTPKQEEPKLPLSERLNFQEISKAYSNEIAMKESSRCLSCGVPVGYHNACWYCLPCEVSCPEKALKVEIPYSIR